MPRRQAGPTNLGHIVGTRWCTTPRRLALDVIAEEGGSCVRFCSNAASSAPAWSYHKHGGDIREELRRQISATSRTVAAALSNTGEGIRARNQREPGTR